MSVRVFAICAFCFLLNASAEGSDAGKGLVKGKLKLVSFNEVEMAGEKTPKKVTAHNYADYPLLIRERNSQKEVAGLNVDADGNYRIALPAGDYVLDIAGRGRKRIRANPRLFTVASNQTVRVDMEIDTGVR